MGQNGMKQRSNGFKLQIETILDIVTILKNLRHQLGLKCVNCKTVSFYYIFQKLDIAANWQKGVCYGNIYRYFGFEAMNQPRFMYPESLLLINMLILSFSF